MRRGRPSTTAIFVACARGAGGVDPIAQRVVPPAFSLLARMPVHRLSPLAPLVTLMRVRTRAIDDVVENAAREGAAQLVTLGAGLCARPWRLRGLRDSIVYEVDHPATQGYKRTRLHDLAPTAREVRFVPVDFERDDLGSALDAAGHDAAAPTTWVWEGVTPYLTPDAIASTLASVRARSPNGSTIALTYYPPSDWQGHPMLRAVSLGARILGEPFRGLMPVGAMHTLLERNGFVVRDDAPNSELAARMGLRSAWPAIEERVLVATRA